MKGVFLFLFSCLLFFFAKAQNTFIYSGKVYFEKRVNQYQLLNMEDEEYWSELMKKTMPKITVDEFVLSFNKGFSLYEMPKENENNKYIFGLKPSTQNIVWKNIEHNKIEEQKEVFEQQYLLKDSLRKLEWRITGETREIAGFDCKKAITKICDSVYVVAFYTDQIPVSSGPESFSGLPGLILGLAVPRLYTTWFATKLELLPPNTNISMPKLKGKVTNWEALQNDLLNGMKDWGKSGPKYVWNALL